MISSSFSISEHLRNLVPVIGIFRRDNLFIFRKILSYQLNLEILHVLRRYSSSIDVFARDWSTTCTDTRRLHRPYCSSSRYVNCSFIFNAEGNGGRLEKRNYITGPENAVSNFKTTKRDIEWKLENSQMQKRRKVCDSSGITKRWFTCSAFWDYIISIRAVSFPMPTYKTA